MTFMTWSDYYLTGIDIVDQQHQHLVEMINDAAPFLASDPQSDSERTKQLLDALIQYVSSHFNTEDHLMVERGIDPRHLQHHRQSHSEFAQHVITLRRQFEAGQEMQGSDLLRYLSNWLAFHILGEDQRMAREMQASDQGISPEEAYEQVEGNLAEVLQTANTVLVNALVNLFDQLTRQNRQLQEKNQQVASHNQELDHYRQDLERVVSQRTQELERAREKAEAASLAKNRFLSTASHELLTPLNAIMGFAQLLERADIPEKSRGHAERIVASAEKLNAQINEILLFAKLEAGEVEGEPTPFLASTLIEQVTEITRKQAQSKGLTVTTYVEPGLPPLKGASNLLRLALEALACNAVKFTADGGVLLAARLLDREDDRIKISFEVQDTGIGIAVDKQRALFQAFGQLDTTMTRRHPGLGLGLVICAHLVARMDGELTLESNPGVGSLFRIAVWLDNGATAQVSPADGPKRPISETLSEFRALLAQDNIAACQLLPALQPHLSGLNQDATQLLTQQLRAYEFEAALQTLNRIKPS